MRAFVFAGNLVSRLTRQNQSFPNKPGLVSWIWRHLLVTVIPLGILLPLQGQNTTAPEYLAKAHYLANFPSFVEWPPEALPTGKATFLVCVFGDFSFGTSLAESTRGEIVRDRRVEVRWVHKPQELTLCQVVFVSHSEQKNYMRVLEAVRGRMILTVGETSEFLDAGGILSFSSQQGTIQFDVNLDAAKKAQLKISSRLLALARRVLNQTESAKS